ncbi:MAG: hypothetical protein ED557_08490 [Balneola sp.]|nr:MAG: hypothetical protein ED557_08490 [Balneola sp.]
MWRPLHLDYILSKYEPLSAKVIVPLISWILIISGTIAVTFINLPEDWISQSSDRSQLLTFFILNPPLLICLLLLFWVGFEWAFIPIFLSMFIIGIFSHLPFYWSILFALSFVFGLSIYAIVYHSLSVDYKLRGIMSVVVYIITSFISATASSLGAFIWSMSHDLTVSQTESLWNGWWAGSFLQSIIIVGPLLFIFSPKIEQFKVRQYEVPDRGEISLNWIYSTIVVVTIVISVFIYSGKYLGQQRVAEEVMAMESKSLELIIGSLESFQVITWISIWIILCVGFGAVFLIGSWNRELKAKVEEKTFSLKKIEEELIQSLSEKEVLLKEIHHRVKNNLAVVTALLDLQYMNTNEEKVKHVLSDSKSRVKSMAYIHETLYQTENFSKVDLQEYLDRLCKSINTTFNPMGKNISIILDTSGHSLEMSKAIPLGLLLNELLVNSYKHAFTNREKGTINVGLEKNGDKLELKVRDNGVGFELNENRERNKTLGMTIIKTLARQLQGEVEMNSQESGTQFKLTMKLAS